MEEKKYLMITLNDSDFSYRILQIANDIYDYYDHNPSRFVIDTELIKEIVINHLTMIEKLRCQMRNREYRDHSEYFSRLSVKIIQENEIPEWTDAEYVFMPLFYSEKGCFIK